MKRTLFIGIFSALLLIGLNIVSAHELGPQPAVVEDGTNKIDLNLTSAYEHTLTFRFYDENKQSIMDYTVSSLNYPQVLDLDSIDSRIAYMTFDLNVRNGGSYTIGDPHAPIPTVWGTKISTFGTFDDARVRVSAG